MHTPEEQAWDRDDLFEEIAHEIDEAYLDGRSVGIIKVAVRNFDLPATVSNGIIYVQIPFPFLLQTVAAGIPDGLRDLETRVSVTGGPALPPVGVRSPVPSKGMVIEGVVRNGPVE